MNDNTPEYATKKQQRIKSLDGLRAISIIFVLFAHLNNSNGFISINKRYAGNIGALGVSVFFIISGYLITKLLIDEELRNKTINLQFFYIRRAIRLSPCLILYMLTIIILNITNTLHTDPNNWIYSVTYTMNYYPDRAWELGHLWSLSIEEQFYLLWPILFKLHHKNRLNILKASIVIAVICRLVITLFFAKSSIGQMEIFPANMDGIAMGCVLGIYQNDFHKNKLYLKLISSKFFLILTIPILIINLSGGYSITYIAFTTISNLLITISVDRFSTINNNTSFKILNNKYFSLVGKMSYSIYIWQQLFLNKKSLEIYNKFPLSLMLTLFTASISYNFIEKNFLKLNKKYRT